MHLGRSTAVSVPSNAGEHWLNLDEDTKKACEKKADSLVAQAQERVDATAGAAIVLTTPRSAVPTLPSRPDVQAPSSYDLIQWQQQQHQHQLIMAQQRQRYEMWLEQQRIAALAHLQTMNQHQVQLRPRYPLHPSNPADAARLAYEVQAHQMGVAPMQYYAVNPPNGAPFVRAGVIPNLPASQETAEQEDYDDVGQNNAYVNYKPRKLQKGTAHPDPVLESTTLSAVDPPDITYLPNLPEEVYTEGRLSNLQLEVIHYAGQQHESPLLPDGTRPGFFLADGAGVGKGRQQAGIIFDNWRRGRHKHIWISASNHLILDAQRDLKDIGAGSIPCFSLSKQDYGPIPKSFGILFLTYTSMVGKSQSGGGTKTRYKQILNWCKKKPARSKKTEDGAAQKDEGFEGCILFDECHRAKNLFPRGGKATQAALLVQQLQTDLPKARVVYTSATGVSETRNMGYMSRLGLWGRGTPFPQGFLQFTKEVESHGVGAMELVAMDLKQTGKFMSRTLAFEGCSFELFEDAITQEAELIYDKAADLWADLYTALKNKRDFPADSGIPATNSVGRPPKAMSRQRSESDSGCESTPARLGGMHPHVRAHMYFWGLHQRFFRGLCIALKVSSAIKAAKEALAEGNCVVIGLQSTGEANIGAVFADGEVSEDGFLSAPAEAVKKMIHKLFPVDSNDSDKKEETNESDSTDTSSARVRPSRGSKISKKVQKPMKKFFNKVPAKLSSEDSGGRSLRARTHVVNYREPTERDIQYISSGSGSEGEAEETEKVAERDQESEVEEEDFAGEEEEDEEEEDEGEYNSEALESDALEVEGGGEDNEQPSASRGKQKRSGSESEMAKGVKKAKTDNSNVVDISLDSDDAEPEGKEDDKEPMRLRGGGTKQDQSKSSNTAAKKEKNKPDTSATVKKPQGDRAPTSTADATADSKPQAQAVPRAKKGTWKEAADAPSSKQESNSKKGEKQNKGSSAGAAAAQNKGEKQNKGSSAGDAAAQNKGAGPSVKLNGFPRQPSLSKKESCSDGQNGERSSDSETVSASDSEHSGPAIPRTRPQKNSKAEPVKCEPLKNEESNGATDRGSEAASQISTNKVSPSERITEECKAGKSDGSTIRPSFQTAKQIKENLPPKATSSMGTFLTENEMEERRKWVQEILARIDDLNLPGNPLDELIDGLGGPSQVAEMTGRRVRMERGTDGKVRCRKRSDGAVSMDKVNMVEKDHFQSGSKLVAIISEAASSGISLQSDRRVNNQRRRVHIILELPWSAEKAIQQMGRSHRSNQVNSPAYKLLLSSVGGEKRFAAAVSKQLESLGALTHGDRRATFEGSGLGLAAFNVDTKYGKQALEQVFKYIGHGYVQCVKPPSIPEEDIAEMRSKGFGVVQRQAAGLVKVIVKKCSPLGVKLMHMTTSIGPGVVVSGFLDDISEEIREQFKHEDIIIGVNTTRVTEIEHVFQTLRDVENGTEIVFTVKRTSVVSEEVPIDTRQILTQWLTCVGMGKDSQAFEKPEVARFLNRLLGMRVNRQTIFLTCFLDTLEMLLQNSRREGKYDDGVLELRGQTVTVKGKPKVLRPAGPTCAVPSLLYKIELDRGVTWKKALETYRQKVPSTENEEEPKQESNQSPTRKKPKNSEKSAGVIEIDESGDSSDDTKETSSRTFTRKRNKKGASLDGFYCSLRKFAGQHFVVLALSQPERPGVQTSFVQIFRPATGQRLANRDLLDKYAKTSVEEAEILWNQEYEDLDPHTQAPKRIAVEHVLAGSILPLWKKIEMAIALVEGRFKGMKVVRACETEQEKLPETKRKKHKLKEEKTKSEKGKNRKKDSADKGQKNKQIIGILIPHHCVEAVVAAVSTEVEREKALTSLSGVRAEKTTVSGVEKDVLCLSDNESDDSEENYSSSENETASDASEKLKGEVESGSENKNENSMKIDSIHKLNAANTQTSHNRRNPESPIKTNSLQGQDRVQGSDDEIESQDGICI